MKKAHVAILAAGGLAVTAYVATKFLTPERDRVARVARGVVRCVERRDAAGLCLLLTEDFRDDHGHASRAMFRETATVGLRLLEKLSISVSDRQIEVEGDTATAEFWLKAIVRERSRERAWTHETLVRLLLRKVDGDWRVYKAEYRLPVGIRLRL